jgi:hypothetical protein
MKLGLMATKYWTAMALMGGTPSTTVTSAGPTTLPTTRKLGFAELTV